MLVRGRAPIAPGIDRVVVGPGAGVCFDGDRMRLPLVVATVVDGSFRSEHLDATALSTMRRRVSGGVATGAPAVWLRGRSWLVTHLGPWAGELESALAAVARDEGVPFLAWSGVPADDDASAANGVYDVVVDGTPAWLPVPSDAGDE